MLNTFISTFPKKFGKARNSFCCCLIKSDNYAIHLFVPKYIVILKQFVSSFPKKLVTLYNPFCYGLIWSDNYAILRSQINFNNLYAIHLLISIYIRIQSVGVILGCYFYIVCRLVCRQLIKKIWNKQFYVYRRNIFQLILCCDPWQNRKQIEDIKDI